MKSVAQVSTQFADIKAVLDQCLAHGGGTYSAPDPGKAVNFRHRCYQFRKQYREAIAPGASPYDMLIIRQILRGETDVKIEPQTLSGTFTPAEGAPLTSLPDDEDRELEEMARELKSRLPKMGLDL